MDNQLEELKKQWKGLSSASPVFPRCEEGAYRPTSRISSRRVKLQRFYRNISIVAGLWIVLTPLLLYPQNLMPMWGCVIISAFFAVMGGLSFDLYLRIKQLDFATMSTYTLLASIERIYHDYIRNTVIGIAMGIPLLTMMLYYFSDQEAALAGGIAGAILGAYAGWMKNRVIRGYLKEIRQELLSVS